MLPNSIEKKKDLMNAKQQIMKPAVFNEIYWS
jgi:hypothetical protein